MKTEFQQIIEKLNQLEQKISEQNMLIKDVLTLEEACKYIHISVSHMYKLTMNKDIPHYKCGRRLYFNRHILEHWIQNREI